jgi:hypothetical protein
MLFAASSWFSWLATIRAISSALPGVSPTDLASTTVQLFFYALDYPLQRAGFFFPFTGTVAYRALHKKVKSELSARVTFSVGGG